MVTEFTEFLSPKAFMLKEHIDQKMQECESKKSEDLQITHNDLVQKYDVAFAEIMNGNVTMSGEALLEIGVPSN